MKIESNVFGKELEKLLLIANIKNITLAQRLKYDVSYISKWISGKSAPSKKSIGEVCEIITNLVMDSANEQAISHLERIYDVSQSALKERILKALHDGYFQSVGRSNHDKYFNNGVVKIRPEGQYPLLMDYATEIDDAKPLDIVVLADIFSLDRKSKLLLAGIEDNKFRIDKVRKDISLNFIIDIDRLKSGSVYDVILFIHMLTNYSRLNFNVTRNSFARGKLIFAVKEHYAGMTVLSDDHQFFSTYSTKDKDVVRQFYNEMISYHNPEEKVFNCSSLQEMLQNHEYVQSLLSQNSKWLVGHMTEQFLSKELFYSLCEDIFANDISLREEAEKAFYLTNLLIEKKQINVMMYESALTSFMLTGELDFFNHKIILPPKQRKDQLEYVKKQFGKLGFNRIKLVDGGFSDDFRFITNPCVFLSDSIDYLRLENNYYEQNILLIYEKQVKKIFHEFFDEIWNKWHDVVIQDDAVIENHMNNLIGAAERLSDID